MSFCVACGHQTEAKIPLGDHKSRLVCIHCGNIHYENPKVICGALAIWEDKVLLCRRAIEPRYGLWTLPAGYMELFETMNRAQRVKPVKRPRQRLRLNSFTVCTISPVLGKSTSCSRHN